MKKTANKLIINYFWIIGGIFIMALGLNTLLVPNKISAGGISTLATIALYVFKLPVSITTLVLNALLFFFAFKYLEKRALINTVLGIILLSLFISITSKLPPLTNDLIIASISGGGLLGLGVGLVLRNNASTGGSDLAALIFNRIFPHVSMANIILIMDFFVIALAYIVFQSITIIFYSLLSIFIFTKVIDTILTMGISAKSVYIFSNKPEELSINIMARLKRGVTGIQSKGMYTDAPKTTLLCVVSAKEIPSLIDIIRKTDSSSFIVVSDAREVLGSGFN